MLPGIAGRSSVMGGFGIFSGKEPLKAPEAPFPGAGAQDALAPGVFIISRNLVGVRHDFRFVDLGIYNHPHTCAHTRTHTHTHRVWAPEVRKQRGDLSALSVASSRVPRGSRYPARAAAPLGKARGRVPPGVFGAPPERGGRLAPLGRVPSWETTGGGPPWGQCSRCNPPLLCPGKEKPDADSDERSRGNFEVAFRPQKSVKAGREPRPEAGGDLASGSEAVAQPARPAEGGPRVNPGPAAFQSCCPGWCSAFYEADCFGPDVHNYVQELARRKATGSPDAQSPVSPALLSTAGGKVTPGREGHHWRGRSPLAGKVTPGGEGHRGWGGSLGPRGRAQAGAPRSLR